MAKDLRSRMTKASSRQSNTSFNDAKSIIGEHPQEAKRIEDTLKKFQGKSEKELMDELQKAASRGRASGEITDDRIDKFARQVMPMMDSTQQQKLKQLMGMLKK
jgi:hypothetical protein